MYSDSRDRARSPAQRGPGAGVRRPGEKRPREGPPVGVDHAESICIPIGGEPQPEPPPSANLARQRAEVLGNRIRRLPAEAGVPIASSNLHHEPAANQGLVQKPGTGPVEGVVEQLHARSAHARPIELPEQPVEVGTSQVDGPPARLGLGRGPGGEHLRRPRLEPVRDLIRRPASEGRHHLEPLVFRGVVARRKDDAGCGPPVANGGAGHRRRHWTARADRADSGSREHPSCHACEAISEEPGVVGHDDPGPDSGFARPAGDCSRNRPHAVEPEVVGEDPTPAAGSEANRHETIDR